MQEINEDTEEKQKIQKEKKDSRLKAMRNEYERN